MWAGGWTWFPAALCARKRSGAGAGATHASLCASRLESSGAPSPEGLPHTLGSRGPVLCHPGHAPVCPPVRQAPAWPPLSVPAVLTGGSSALHPAALPCTQQLCPAPSSSAGSPFCRRPRHGPRWWTWGPAGRPLARPPPASPVTSLPAWCGRACADPGWPATAP